MITEDVVNYIREAKARGRSVEEIKSSLAGAGWKEADISEAVAQVSGGAVPSPVVKEPPVTAQSPLSPQTGVAPTSATPVNQPAVAPVSVPSEAKPLVPAEAATSWGTVGSGAGSSGDTITLPQIDTEKIAPQVSMKEVPGSSANGDEPPSVSVMASVQRLDAGVQPTNSMKSNKYGGGLSKKLLLWIVLGLLLIGGGIGAFVAYNYFFNNPLRIVSTAIAKTLAADSFSMGVSLPENKQVGNFSGTINYLKGAGKLSKADFKLEAVGGDGEKTVAISTIFGGDEVFFKPSYTQLGQLQGWMKSGYPKLENLRIYQVAQPVLMGDSWFDAKLPKGEMSMETVKKLLGIDPNKEGILRDKLVKSLVVRKFETTNVGGNSYSRIVFGFNKDNLIDLLGSLQGIDTQSSVVGELKNAAGAVSNWDVDLVEVLVDKKSGNLTSVAISLPGVSKERIASDLSGANFGGLPVSMVANYLPSQTEGQTQYLGKLTFANFGGGTAEAKPISVIDFGTTIDLARVELPPILSGYLSHGRLPEPFEINIAEAKNLWEKGAYRESLTQAGNMIGIAKTNGEKAMVHYWIGADSYKLGDLVTAEKEELLATTLDQKSGVPYAILALMAIDKGDFKKAYDYAVKGVALETGSAWTHNSLGLAYLGLNRKPEAIAELKKAVALASGNAEIQVNLDKALSPGPSPLPTPKPSPLPKTKTATSSALTASPTPTASSSGSTNPWPISL